MQKALVEKVDNMYEPTWNFRGKMETIRKHLMEILEIKQDETKISYIQHQIKTHWNTTYLSECINFKRPTISRTGQNFEQLELLYIADEHTKWYSHFRI